MIIGARNRTAVATLAERTSRLTFAVALPGGYDAPHTAEAVTDALARQTRHLVKTLTWDQGRGTARRADIEAALGIDVCLCDPHSPRQRPTNEHTNGLLRRWLPKGTELNVGQARLGSSRTVSKGSDFDCPHVQPECACGIGQRFVAVAGGEAYLGVDGACGGDCFQRQQVQPQSARQQFGHRPPQRAQRYHLDVGWKSHNRRDCR